MKEDINKYETLYCIRCNKEIKPKEHFIQITEWDNEKLFKKNRCHYSCWELFVDEKNTKRAALGMLKEAMGKLREVSS